MKRILLTGSTGVIGSALVPHLLQGADDRIDLLVRANSPADLQRRKTELCKYWGLDPQSPKGLQLRFHAGDVCQPRLGFPAPLWDELTASVTHVVHAAGDVRLNQGWGEAQRNAVSSAEHVLEFTRVARRHGPLLKVEMVSTVGVAGCQSGTIPEERLTGAGPFRNHYEAAKAAAELRIWQAIDEGLPISIHRPSMVVGDSRDGRILHFQVFYHICQFLTGKRTRGWLPRFGTCALDVVPVDYVAQALHAAMNQPPLAGQVFHLCGGAQNAWDLESLMLTAREYYTARGWILPPLRRTSVGMLELLLTSVRWLSWGRTRRFLSNLPFFFAYLKQSQRFDVVRTHARIGAPYPQIGRNLCGLSRLLDYHWARTQSSHR